MKETKPEVWQRGPIYNVPELLQPVAHALLQAREEVNVLMKDFSDHLLWLRPAGLASPAFHLQHLSGVLDRLFTYAKGESLTTEQRQALANETLENAAELNSVVLLQRFNKQVDAAIEQLQHTPADSLTEFRGIGAKQLPSTVMGLLFHAAEHTMRHLGQLYVTVKFLEQETVK